jgi:hypothetical protein
MVYNPSIGIKEQNKNSHSKRSGGACGEFSHTNTDSFNQPKVQDNKLKDVEKSSGSYVNWIIVQTHIQRK